jgi:predicted transposase/invertase (TIGR01784 family)
MPITKFLDPKNDYAFKRIFGTERNQDILIHFLNDMLGFSGREAIKEVTFLKTAQDPDIAAAKQSSVDVMCTDDLNRQYIVEMQVARAKGFEKRAQYYAAKAYSRQMLQGDQYSQLKEIIFLAITDFVMFPDKTEYKSNHIILDKATYSHDLKDFSFTFLELPKFNKTIDTLNNIIEKWAYFFRYAEETNEKDLAKLIGTDIVIQRAYEELNRFAWTEIELNTYEQEEKRTLDAQAIIMQKWDEGKAKGLAEGLAKGKAEGLREGVVKGKQEGEVAMLLQFIQLKFKRMPAELENKIRQMDAEALLAFSAKILTATCLDEL